MNRTERLYAIAESLRAAGARGRTAAFLSAQFEVSPRTIKRDVLALVKAGTAVRSQDGRGGGYQLDRASSLPPVSFSAGEAVAVAVAIAAEPQAPFRSEARTALSKLLRAMSPTTQAETRELARRVWMRVPATSARPATARLVDEALRQRVAISLSYLDGAGKSTRRKVDPLALARTHGHWYLLAWCHARNAGRWFRLDRIRRVTLSRERIQDRDLSDVFGKPPADAHPIAL